MECCSIDHALCYLLVELLCWGACEREQSPQRQKNWREVSLSLSPRVNSSCSFVSSCSEPHTGTIPCGVKTGASSSVPICSGSSFHSICHGRTRGRILAAIGQGGQDQQNRPTLVVLRSGSRSNYCRVMLLISNYHTLFLIHCG